MIPLPSPAHPAIVHFPIVLVLLGTVAAVVAVFTSRWHVRGVAAILLALGAAGVVAAVSTGEDEGEALDRTPTIEALLNEHEVWADRTELASIVAATLALAALATMRWRPRAARAVSTVCAVGAIAASVGIYQTGHRGGQMVFRHGAGVNLATADAQSPARQDAAPPRERERRSDDS